MWHASSICVAWHIHICLITNPYVSGIQGMNASCHSHMTASFHTEMRHDTHIYRQVVSNMRMIHFAHAKQGISPTHPYPHTHHTHHTHLHTPQLSTFELNLPILDSWDVSRVELIDQVLWHVRRDSFIFSTELIYVCDVTHPHVWRYFIRDTWLVHMCDMTHSYVWRDSFICAP